jgi:hypothetical protein
MSRRNFTVLNIVQSDSPEYISTDYSECLKLAHLSGISVNSFSSLTARRIRECFWEMFNEIPKGPRITDVEWFLTNQSRQQIQIPGIHSGSHRCNHLRNREKNKRGKKSDWHVNSVLWSKTILHKTKQLTYQALVKSILLYGACKHTTGEKITGNWDGFLEIC